MSKELAQAQFGPRAIEYVHSDVQARSESLDAMLGWLQRDPIPLALDIATGGGHTALALSPLAKKVVASDITVPMLSATRDWISKNGASNDLFCQHDAGLIPFPDLTFDVVTCRLAPHHFQDLNAFMRECARVLRIGGQLAIIDNVTPSEPMAARFINAYERLRDHSHHFELSPPEWETCFSTSGLTVEHQQQFRKSMDFGAYCDRMGVPARSRTRLRVMLLHAPAEARAMLNPREVDGRMTFDLGELLIVGRRSVR
jgi:ubiquinone/menaquinone biosynthesis C-methylase UbiE